MPQPTNAGRGIFSYLFGRDDQPFGDSWRDQWSQGVGNAAGILGFNPDRTASTTRRVIDFVPGVGDAISLNDAKRDFDAGNYGSAAVNAGTGILGLVPGGGDAAAVAGKGLLTAIGGGIGKRGVLDALMEAAKARGVDLVLTPSHSGVVVNKIVVPKEARGKGVGTSVMNDIINYADREGVTLSLDPSSDFGGNKAKLEKFYGGLGFEPNIGRKRDFEISQSMRRYPKR